MEQQNENVTLLYIQKQEQIILEYVRRSLDYEIKLHLLNDKINEQNNKIKELTQVIENQNSIVQQATVSIESLTEENRTVKANDRTKELSEAIEKQNFTIHQLNSSVHSLTEENKILKNNDKTKEFYDMTNNMIELKNKLEIEERKNKDLQSEILRQNEELTKLHNEGIPKKKKQKVQDETF